MSSNSNLVNHWGGSNQYNSIQWVVVEQQSWEVLGWVTERSLSFSDNQRSTCDNIWAIQLAWCKVLGWVIFGRRVYPFEMAPMQWHNCSRLGWSWWRCWKMRRPDVGLANMEFRLTEWNKGVWGRGYTCVVQKLQHLETCSHLHWYCCSILEWLLWHCGAGLSEHWKSGSCGPTVVHHTVKSP